MSNKKITGGCYCKTIRYELDAIIKAGICYCRSCQHLTGGIAWPFIVANKDSMHIRGSFSEHTRLAESGHKIHMGFCPHCGTTLFGRPERWPNVLTISASSLDHSELFVPTMNVWVEDALPWMTLNHDIDQFKRGSN